MKHNRSSTKRSKGPFIIGISMIVGVIAIMIVKGRMEQDSPVLFFLAIMIVVAGCTAAIIYSNVQASKQRKLMGEEPKKKTRADVMMYISSGIGGIGLLGLIWSFVFSEEINYPLLFGELVVFIAGFSVTYNIFMKTKMKSLSDKNEESEENKL